MNIRERFISRVVSRRSDYIFDTTGDLSAEGNDGATATAVVFDSGDATYEGMDDLDVLSGEAASESGGGLKKIKNKKKKGKK